ncbi:MAG: hypothetical protein WD768_16210 [Phycisphaeraceae bacterium]
MTRIVSFSLALVAMLAIASTASAQLTKEQLDKVRQQRNQEGITTQGTSSRQSPVRSLYSTLIDPVTIDNTKARDAFRWWSNVTGIPLVINWREMEAAGIDADTLIDLQLRNAPAAAVLSLMLRQLSPDKPLMYETSDWYIRIMTKEEANKDTVILVYDIKDLTKRIPNFDNAPGFDLNSALSNTSSGGSSGGGATSATTLFKEGGDDEIKTTEAERGEELAQLIREMIEPTIWQELGGEHSSVKYFQGRLIVKAPRYVHAQIGFPTAGASRSVTSKFTSITAPPRSSTNDVSGVRPSTDKVAGVGK